MRDSALNDPICDVEDDPSELRSWIHWSAADQIEELQAELAGVKEDRDALEIEVRSQRFTVDREMFDVMRRVREWFHDRILYGGVKVPKQLCRDLDDIVLGR